MSLTLALLLAATTGAGPELSVRELAFSDEALQKPIKIDCPVSVTTRLVLPEAIVRSSVSQNGREQFAITKIASRPLGVMQFHPVEHPADATLDIWGTSGRRYTFKLQTVEKGHGTELRIKRSEAKLIEETPVRPKATETIAPTVAPTSAPTAAPARATATSSPSPRPTVAPTETPTKHSKARATATSTATATATVTASPTATDVAPEVAAPAVDACPSKFDATLMGLAVASGLKSDRIGEKAGNPGQKSMILEDALQSSDCVWYHFRLERGRDEQVASAQTYPLLAQPRDRDLHVTVQIPRSVNDAIRKKGGLEIELVGGTKYKFRLSTPLFWRSLTDAAKAANPLGHKE